MALSWALKRLQPLYRRGLSRSCAAFAGVRGHIATGGITPLESVVIGGEVKALRRLKLLAFAEDEVERYKVWLTDHGDGRLRRFNMTAPEAKPFRAVWHEARHKNTAEYGRLAPLIAAADNKRSGRKLELTPEQQSRILELRARGGKGGSVRAIAQNVGVGRGQVERFLKSQTVTKPPLTH